jgi:hypothetical protein
MGWWLANQSTSAFGLGRSIIAHTPRCMDYNRMEEDGNTSYLFALHLIVNVCTGTVGAGCEHHDARRPKG